MLHGSETWPIRKENEVTRQQAEMIMVRWMLMLRKRSRVPSEEMRERLEIDHISLILQENRLQWACVARRRQRLGEEMYGV